MVVEIGHLNADELDEMKNSQSASADKQQIAKRFQRGWVKQRLAVTGKQYITQEKKALTKSRYPPLPGNMPTHAECKSWLPKETPAVAVWRVLSNGGWRCHCKPFKRRSFSWVKHGGGMEACVAMLQYIWSTFLELRGLQLADCPVPGLFLAQ